MCYSSLVLFNPSLAGTESGELPKAKKLNFFASHLETPLTISNDYFDFEEAQREMVDARRRITREKQLVDSFKLSVDKATYQKFRTNEDRRHEVMDFLIDLRRVDTPSFQWLSTKHITGIGAASLHHHLVERMRDFDHALGFHHQDTVYTYMDWDHSGISLVSIGGVRPLDFIAEKANVRPQLLDAFRFLVEAHLILADNKYDQALAETQGELFQLYPNVTKNKVALAATAISYLVDIPAEYFEVGNSGFQQKTSSEIIKWSKKYIDRALEVGRAANQVLTNPDSPEFLDFSQEIQGYMAQGRLAELRVLNVLGIKDGDQAKNLYRKARELARTYPQHTAFYADFADSIRDFQIEMPQDTTILTADDVPTLIDEDKLVPDSKSLIMTAQSPEYTPVPPAPVAMSEQEARDLAIGGPRISVPSVFQGFKYENELYYGIQSFGLVRELPKEQVTQYRTNGRDILKIKALYGDYGMVTHRIFPETPPKIWGIISGTGNQVYPGLTVQGILDNELTEPVFEQILSTFGLTQ